MFYKIPSLFSPLVIHTGNLEFEKKNWIDGFFTIIFSNDWCLKIRHERWEKKKYVIYQIMLAASTSQTNILVMKKVMNPFHWSKSWERVPTSWYIEINKKGNKPCMFGVIKGRPSWSSLSPHWSIWMNACAQLNVSFLSLLCHRGSI